MRPTNAWSYQSAPSRADGLEAPRSLNGYDVSLQKPNAVGAQLIVRQPLPLDLLDGKGNA
jgi:hypothetical protein